MFLKKKIVENLEIKKVHCYGGIIESIRVDDLENNGRRADNKLIVETIEAMTIALERQIAINDLLLSHLNLEYIPEAEKKEPAKLVEKKTVLGVDWELVGDDYSITSTWVPTFKSEPKKKKRGRPKKK